ncbi:hypothetical protein BCEP4_220055 [Burkholderia cepacia]|nr:hypothetical protein BCEP4_220055 [Burkholderia cepacia]
MSIAGPTEVVTKEAKVLVVKDEVDRPAEPVAAVHAHLVGDVLQMPFEGRQTNRAGATGMDRQSAAVSMGGW